MAKKAVTPERNPERNPERTAGGKTTGGASDDPPVLLLLDGHSLAYRGFFALKDVEMSTTDGQPTTAVFGFTSMLINVLRDEAPSHVAVAFDRSEPTFRHEQYVEYKANRAETPDEFRGQIPLIFEVLDTLRIPRFSVAGYEADDLIATLTTRATSAGMRVLIVTGDRDALQLVNDDVTVLMTRRGISEMTRYTPEAVQDKYGLTPVQYPDFAAIRGDPSDNLPNIPGVGEKTAAKWIREFGSLTELVDRVDEVKGKAGDKLRERLPDVLRNRQLTELRCDVPLDAEPAGLVMGEWDSEALHTLFDTLQFRVLRERLYAALRPTAAVAAEAFTVELTVARPGELAGWLAGHVAEPGVRAGLAVAGTWGRGTGTVTGLAIAADDGAAVHVEPGELTDADRGALAAWLADAGTAKAVHDAKGPMLALHALGMPLAGVTSDTALAAYLALPGQRTFDLADLALRYVHRELRSEAPADGQLTLDGTGEEQVARDLALRAKATGELAGALDADLERRGALRLLHEVELPLVEVLAGMERRGIAADAARLSEQSAALGEVAREAERAAHEAVGSQFNLGSPKQLQQVLFTDLGLPKTKRIKTGYTTDSDALTQLLARTGHPVLEHLLRYRDVAKLKSIVDSLVPMIDGGGRIHTTYNQTVAATGRLSSTDPNLQNIPIRTADGRRIRQAFVVGREYECLLTADYSQIELRIMAHLSGDEALIEAFSSGYDFHAATASRVFGIPADAVDGAIRGRIKAMNYGLAYGLSAYGLSQQLDISATEARGLMEEYFQQFGGVRDYLAEVVERARKDGYTETMLGRRRYLPDLNSDSRQRREMAERMALNAPIQGSAADIIKVAMLRVDAALADAGLGSRVLLQVHDELVLEVAPGELARVRAVVGEQMAGAYPLRVPLSVSMGTGANWDEAAH